eukprot:g3791.t1
MVVSHELEFISKPTPDSIESDKDDLTSVASFTCPDSDPFLIVNASHFKANGFVIRKCDAPYDANVVTISKYTKALFSNVRISNNKRRILNVQSNAELTLRSSYFESNGLEDEVGGVIFGGSYVNITIRKCLFLNNSAFSGSVINSDEHNNIMIAESTLTDNEAGWYGGVIDLYGGSITINHSTLNGKSFVSLLTLVRQGEFVDNEAGIDGGVIDLYGGSITINHSTLNGKSFVSLLTLVRQGEFVDNEAGIDGGVIDLYDGSITINHSTLNGKSFVSLLTLVRQGEFVDNEAGIDGGVIDLYGGSITINHSTLNGNIAKLNGGALKGAPSAITIEDSMFIGNNATNGGVLYLDVNSEATITNSTLLGNSASQGGGIFSNQEVKLEISQSMFTENSAITGGCLYAVGSSLKAQAQHCTFSRNNASQYGGCSYFEACTVNLTPNTFIMNRAKESGRGIYVTRTASLHVKRTRFRNNSANSGGGVAIHNKAIQGGALYIKSNGRNYLVAQLTKSTFRNNTASSYGGGMVVKTFGIKTLNCTDIRSNCDRVVLFGVSFIKNTAASFGSIITSASPDNVLVNCDANYSTTADLMSRVELEHLMRHNLKTIRPKKMCDSWKDEWLTNIEQKVAIGTFGYKLNIRTNSTNGTQIVRAGDGDFKLDVDRSAKFPAIIIDALDAFGNSSAPLLFDNDALVLSSPNGYFRESSVSFELNLSCIISYTFEDLRSLNYTIRINPREEDIPKPIFLKIYSSRCGINEVLSRDRSLCRKCSDGAYNFIDSNNTRCTLCPRNANCNGRFIVPHEGYWHKSPCHDKLKKCIFEKACKFKNRTKSLIKFVEGINECINTNTTTVLDKYKTKQCDKGYEGPLCGSCKKSYGSKTNFECIKCKHIMVSIIRVLAIGGYLLFCTALAMKGILPLDSNQRTQNEERVPIIESHEASIIEVTNSNHTREALENGNNSLQSHSSNEVVNRQGNEIEERKGKILEAMKILLNFFQVTSNAETMDIKWTTLALAALQKLQIFGAATINRISSPLDCILSSTSHTTRTIWRVLLSLLVPSIAAAILVTYWAYRTIAIHERDGLYFIKRFLLTVITITYITYFDLTRVAISVFNCVAVYDDPNFDSKLTTSTWIIDTSVECYKSSHFALLIIAIVVLILVSLGFPLFCSFALFIKRDAVNTPRSWAHEILGFLCGPFKERFIYWECITMIKKASLSIVIVFSYSLGNQGQGLLTLLVLVLFLYIHLVCFPYNEEYHTLNYYESGSLLVSCITYTLVQFLNIETCSELSRGIISASLIALNSCFVCIMLYKILKELFSLLRAILESRGILVSENMNIFSFLKFYYQNRRSVPSTS